MKFGERRTGFVALPHFFSESMLLRRHGLREVPFVVATGSGDRALILDTHNLPVRGLIGKTLGTLQRLLPLDVGRSGPVVPEIIPAEDDLLYDMDRRMRLLLEDFTPVIESHQAGHYHIDLGGATVSCSGDPQTAARSIAHRAREWFQYSVRLGVGSNKLIAYLAARSATGGRPLEIPPGEEADFYRPLSVLLLPLPYRFKAELYGSYNVRTIGDLAAFDLEEMQRVFGPRGRTLYEYSRGRSSSEPIAAPEREWLREEVQVASILENRDDLARTRFALVLDRLCGRLRERGVFPGRFALELVYQDDYRTRVERRLRKSTNLAGSLGGPVRPHFERGLTRRIALKKIRLACADFSPAHWQYDLFGESKTGESGKFDGAGKERQLSEACDRIRRRFGMESIGRAAHLIDAE